MEHKTYKAEELVLMFEVPVIDAIKQRELLEEFSKMVPVRTHDLWSQGFTLYLAFNEELRAKLPDLLKQMSAKAGVEVTSWLMNEDTDDIIDADGVFRLMTDKEWHELMSI